MDEYSRRLTNPVLTWGIGLVLGVLIGLVVLGWWLFPVVWVDASPADLLYEYQVESLRADIEAFGYTGDALVAQARYESLGENGETALAQIIQNPGSLPPALLDSFSQAAAGAPASDLAAAEVAVPEPQVRMDTWVAIGGALLLVIAAGLLTFLVLRGRDQVAEAKGIEEIAAAPEPPLEAGEPSETLDLPPFLAAAGLTRAADAAANTPEETALETDLAAYDAEEDLPVTEELQPFEIESTESGETPAADEDHPGAGVGFAAAALVAAELLDTEEEPASTEEITLSGEEAVAVETEDLDFSPSELEAVESSEDVFLPEVEQPAEFTAAEAAVLAAGVVPFLTEQGEPGSETVLEEAAEAEDTLPVSPFVELPADEPAVEETPVGSSNAAAHEPVEVKMRKRLEFIEGIGPVYAMKLFEAGVETTGKLLVEGVSRKGRRELAERSGIPERLILEWVNHVDLYRVKGIGSEYADLLEAAGVDTIPELAQRRADNLYQALEVVNSQRRLVRQLPSESQVADWITQAAQLPRIIQY